MATQNSSRSGWQTAATAAAAAAAEVAAAAFELQSQDAVHISKVSILHWLQYSYSTAQRKTAQPSDHS